MHTAERLDRIKPAATLAMNAAALELKAKGVKVTSLAVGEPDFPPPAHVCAAAKAAIDAGHSHYTDVPGIPDLRKAVGARYKRLYGVDAPPEQTIICNGGKQALYNLFMALLNPGDEVIIPAPYWVSYPDMVVLAEGVPVHVFAGPEQGFKVTVEQLESVRGPRTRVLVYNSPSNPTGAAYSRAERDAVLTWAMEHDIFVVADEIYDQLIYPPAEMLGVGEWRMRYPDRIALVNGLSKTFAMTGWRVGYAIADAALIKAMSKFQGQATSNVCSIAQYAALAALTGGDETVHAMRDVFQARRDMALKEIASWPEVVCPTPDGAFYLFVDMRRLLGPAMPDCASLCTRLLKEANVATVPGAAFGAPGFVRLSYAVREEDMMDALSRVKTVLYG